MQHHDVGGISGTSRKSVHPLDEQVKFATKSHGVKAMVVKNRTMLQIWGEASSPRAPELCLMLSDRPPLQVAALDELVEADPPSWEILEDGRSRPRSQHRHCRHSLRATGSLR